MIFDDESFKEDNNDLFFLINSNKLINYTTGFLFLVSFVWNTNNDNKLNYKIREYTRKKKKKYI